MKYIYGPVRSRRLGLSLGVSLTPYKICNFDCIYCQLGSTGDTVAEIREYTRAQEILNELRSWIENNAGEAAQLDYITIAGAGEPTLDPGIGGLIDGIRKLSSVPIAVITNASLLDSAQVRIGLSRSDLIVPSLDAATEAGFRKVNRPKDGINIENIINGLAALRKEFKGNIWLEVMLVEGVNDGPDDAARLKDIVDRVKPDKVQLNSPVRVAADNNVSSAAGKRLLVFKEVLGDKCEIV